MNLISKVPRLIKPNNLLKLSTSARFQSTLDSNKAEAKPTEGEAYRDLTPSELESIRTMLRINQAGEIGANYIYMGQYQVFKNDKNLKDLILHMWEQEKVHLNKFNELIPEYRSRPTALMPLWKLAGFAVGAGTALMGKETAMMCTEAVETVIGGHYNDQLRELANIKNKDVDELRKVIKQFRDDELEHLDTAVEYDAHQAPLHSFMSNVIKGGCKAAIWVCSKV